VCTCPECGTSQGVISDWFVHSSWFEWRAPPASLLANLDPHLCRRAAWRRHTLLIGFPLLALVLIVCVGATIEKSVSFGAGAAVEHWPFQPDVLCSLRAPVSAALRLINPLSPPYEFFWPYHLEIGLLLIYPAGAVYIGLLAFCWGLDLAALSSAARSDRCRRVLAVSSLFAPGCSLMLWVVVVLLATRLVSFLAAAHPTGFPTERGIHVAAITLCAAISLSGYWGYSVLSHLLSQHGTVIRNWARAYWVILHVLALGSLLVLSTVLKYL